MRDTMLAYFNGKPSTPFTVPQGVQKGRVCYTVPGQKGCVITVEDYYITGTVPTVSGDDRQEQPPAVVTPAKPAQQAQQAKPPPAQAPPKPTKNDNKGGNGRKN